MRRPLSNALLSFALLLAAPASLAAQDEGEDGPEQGQLDDQAARATYQAGREAFAAGDYEAALERFEQAYRLSPRPTLLYLIAQTYDRLRRDADTLDALRRYIEERPDAPNREEIEARIVVLQASVDERRAGEEAQAQAEAERARATARAPAPEPAPSPPPPPEASRPPLHMALFLSTAALALGGGGVAVWTGLETLSLNDRYEAASEYDAARAAYDEGRDYELATNILIFGSGGLAAVAILIAIFTDWEDGGGDEDQALRVRPRLGIGPGGALAGAEATF